MIIPPGFRELRKGEIIRCDDLAYSMRKWVREDSLYDNCTGGRYNPGIFYTTIRKINIINFTEEQKNQIINKLKSNFAFNADSALEVSDDDYELYFTLEQNKIIKSADYGEKECFYLENK